jgi:cell division protein FtsB
LKYKDEAKETALHQHIEDLKHNLTDFISNAARLITAEASSFGVT